MKVTLIFLCSYLMLLAAVVSQTDNRNANDNRPAAGLPCMFDVDRGEVPDCIHVGVDGSRSVTSRYLKELPFTANGLAAVWIAGGWTYVNREGRVVINGVPNSDNGPDEFHEGLVRFVKGHKYGFADRKGRVVIPPQYDGAMPFQGGQARVCLGCVDKCVDRDCEHKAFQGGKWFSINKKGLIPK